MAKQTSPVALPDPAKTATVGSLTFGFLVWWTIHQGVYDLTNLQVKSSSPEFPMAIRNLLTGAEPKTAWLKATQLGVKGSPSATHNPDIAARFLTRDVGDGLRAVIREEIDKDGKAVSTQQLALLGYDDQDPCISATVQRFYDPKDIAQELITLIEAMSANMGNRTGKIDDTKVRSALLRWLELKHRVCVRGTGGVYYIPLTAATFNAVREEVVAVRTWVKDCAVGTFSVVQLTKDGATSINDIQESAVAEILAELATVNDSLDQYANSQGMNHGSRMYSASTQVEKVATLKAKAKHLEEALGDVILKVQVKLDMTEKRAVQMRHEAALVVQSEKVQRESKRSQKGRKSGTAIDRQRVKSV